MKIYLTGHFNVSNCIKSKIHLLVAFNMYYVLYCPQQSCKMELQNNRALTYEGCFAFHQAANAKDSRLSANPKSTQLKY